MEFPTLINWSNPFCIQGLLGSYHEFKIKKCILWANSAEFDQMLHSVVCDLVLHCLPMFHKMDARLIPVKTKNINYPAVHKSTVNDEVKRAALLWT